MYPASFEYFRPKTIAQATAYLAKHKDSKVLAGGHSLLPAMKLRLASPAALVDIGRIAKLAGIRFSKGALEIGALTTHAEVAASEAVRRKCPILAEAAALIGDPQVRNRGTVGGSLAHADPAADYPTVVLALDGTIRAAGPGGPREILASEFFRDLFTTALAHDELLTSVRLPRLAAGTGSAYVKHRHPASGYAVIGAAAIVEIRDGRCSRASLWVGGATATPVRVRGAETALAGQPLSDSAISEASALVAEALANPIGDMYASAEYRLHLAGVLAKRALTLAAERASRRKSVAGRR